MPYILPLFKSTFSIGRSILTLDSPSDSESDGSNSIFSIAVENNLDTIYLVEDSMVGFFNAFKKCKQLGINLIFGYRFTCCNDLENQDSDHKLIVFAKNDQGCRDLNRFYSYVNQQASGKIANKDLSENLTDNLILAVPFYDSFIFKNHLTLGNCIPTFHGLKPIFFIEDNNLPFDNFLKKAVQKFCKGKYETFDTKSIYYQNKEDYEAFQAYKIICNRSFGKQATLSSPNLNHFGSDEFCWESYLEKTKH